jgi:hypothetical protein
MIKEDKATTGSGEEKTATQEEIWLLGQPPLWRYLDWVKDRAVDGDRLDRAALTDEWRKVNGYYRELEEREAGIANQAECRDLHPSLAALAAAVKANPRYRRTFDTLPTSFGMVELDRLIVFQKHVSQSFIEALKAKLGPAPDLEAVFRFCLPLGYPDAPVQIRPVGTHRYVFRSDSTDFRFLEPTLLRPEQIQGYDPFGSIAGVVGLVVGFGTNLLNTIRVGRRMVLHNGYHRVCALRALGIKEAPCIIQTVAGMDELEVATSGDVADHAQFYFESARPPLLKDFFDPQIRKVLRVYKMMRVIEANFEVRDFLVRR